MLTGFDEDDIQAALEALEQTAQPHHDGQADRDNSLTSAGNGANDEAIIFGDGWDLDIDLENMDFQFDEGHLEEDEVLKDPKWFLDLEKFENANQTYEGVTPKIPHIEVSNVVCQSSVNCALDLPRCCKRLKNSTLNTKSFPALFIRLRDPNVTLLVFSNGKVLATGGKSYEEDFRALRRLVKSLHRLGYTDAKLDVVRVRNLVAKINLNFSIQLSKLVEDPLHRRYCQTQAGKFPCVNYKLKTLKPNITVRIFGNGAIGFQSANSLELLQQAVQIMMPVFHQFRLPQYEPVDPRTLLPHISHLEQLV